MAVTDSILTSIKKVLGLDEGYEAFDQDIMLHINSAFATLNQLAVGPENSFRIEDKAARWSDFIMGQPNIDSVKTYVYLKVRLLFDPPATSFAINSFQEQIKELEWRLNVVMEVARHPDGDTTTLVFPDPFWWNLTGDLPFPPQANFGDMGYDAITGNVWRYLP